MAGTSVAGTEEPVEGAGWIWQYIERRIRYLIRQAQMYTSPYDHEEFYDTIRAAEKLRHRNSRLLKIIERTEGKLKPRRKRNESACGAPVARFTAWVGP